MVLRSIVLLGCIAFGSGCALTQTVKNVDYTPTVDKAAAARVSGQPVALGAFIDNRGASDPALLFQKKNIYNNTMAGAYLASRPLVDYVRDGVTASLRQAGVLSESGGLVLTASLEEFEEEVLMGFWSSTMKTKMMVKFQLTDQGRQVWNDTVIGRAQIEKGDFVTQAVSLTTDDLVKQLMQNAQFQAAVSSTDP